MSSNLKVNSLVPATGTEIGIGTTGGSIDFRCAATFGGNVTIGGTLTYDEVINIDSIGVITARSNIDCNGSLDVDGHTNLDNVSIAGVTTMGQTTIFTTGGTTLLLKDSDSSNPADRSGIAFVDQNNTQTAFIGKVSASDAVLTINNTNTINPIRLKVNNTTRLEVGNAGVYATGSLSATGTLSAGGTLYIPDDIQHSGDADTKIRFPTADTVSVETAGSERLRITSAGKVGIGTDLPQEELTIRSSTPALMLRDTDQEGSYTQVSNANQDMYFSANGTSAHANFIFRSGNAGSFLERLRISSGGDMALGTSSPNSYTDQRVFTINGTTYGRLDLEVSGTLKGSIWANSGGLGVDAGGNDIEFYAGSAERLRILSSGELRIISSGNNNDPAHLRLHSADVSISTNDAIGVVRFAGRDAGGAAVSRTGALIQATAAATWDTLQSSGYSATHLDFFTQAHSGTDTIAAGARLRISSGGGILIGSGNQTKTQDGVLIERNSGDGLVHITAGRSGGNYSGFDFYVAGASGVTKRYSIDYQSNFRWYHSNGTTERFKIEQNGTLTSTASNNGQIIHSFKNTDTTAGSSAHTIEHWFRFNRSGGGMDSPAAKIIAGKEREWVGGASNQDGYLAFHTMLNESSSEKVRINSLGDLLINQTTTNDSRLSIKARSSAVDFINCRDTSNTLKFYVHSSGNTYNTNGNYSQISDQSLKENIVDAKSQWNDIKNIKIRNFNFTAASGMDTHTQIGCVAQEVEIVSPKLVTAPRADGIKTVSNSVLYMKAVKALQEAMTRIETLEAEVAALKGS